MGSSSRPCAAIVLTAFSWAALSPTIDRAMPPSRYVRLVTDSLRNARGCLIAGGLNQSTTGAANSNSTVFEAFGSEFVDNTAQIPGIDPGGIRVVGGLSTMSTNVTSDNTVSVSLSGSKSGVTRSSTSKRSARSRPRCQDRGNKQPCEDCTARRQYADRCRGRGQFPRPSGSNAATVIRSPGARSSGRGLAKH